MIVTIYQGAPDERPVSHVVTHFNELQSLLGTQHRVLAPNEKDKTPNSQLAFNGCEFDGIPRIKQTKNGPKETLRSIENAVACHFGCVDIDKKPIEHVNKVLELFNNIPTIVYTTYSHGHKPGVSLRLLFPFSRPVLAKEWAHYMAGFQAATDGIIDTEKDITRLYFVPTRRPERTDAFILYSLDKPGVFDVDAAIAIGKAQQGKASAPATKRAAVLPDGQISQGEEFSEAALKDVVTTLKRSGKTTSKELAAILQCIVDGTVYSKDGERDSALYRVSGAIARYFPYTDPEAIAAYFVRSLDATNAYHKNGSTDDDVRKLIDKLSRQQAKVQEELQQEADRIEEERASDIRALFKRFQVDRQEPYNEDEIQALKDALQARDHADLKRSWIIQNGASYYILTRYGYLPPVSEKALVTAARRDLAPAHTSGVSIYEVTEKGEPARLDAKGLMERYGTVARGTVIDLSAQSSYYDAETQCIIEAPCPLRNITPRFVEGIDEWLFCLAGEDADAYQRLRRWVAFASDLERPCVALYLDGPPGVGKSLFVKGLARLYTTGGAPSLGNAIDKFNDGPLHCAIIKADETLPDDMKGISTTKLREFIQNTDRMVNRKNMPIAKMVGAIRLILAANNKHMIETREALEAADIDAIAERILYVKATARTRQYLEERWGDKINDIVAQDLLAAHALWLRDQKPQAEGRFLVKTGDHTISKALTVHAGDRPVILHWLVSYLLEPQRYDQKGQHRVMVREETLYVQTQALVDHWELYTTNAKAPSTARISSALRAVSTDTRTERINKNVRRYYPIKREILEAWIDEHGIGTREELYAALRVPTKISSRQAISAVPGSGMSAEKA